MSLTNRRKARTPLSVAVLTGVLVLSIAAGRATAADGLRPLSPTDPPDVLTLNHEFNLRLLADALQRTIDAILRAAGDTARSCGTPNCGQEAWSEAYRQRASARKDAALEVEKEQLEYDQALRGAKERIAQEQADRARELEEQRQRNEEQRKQLQAARDDERREAILKFVSQKDPLDEMLQAGDSATSSPAGNPYGDVAPRFKPRRRNVTPRAWRAEAAQGPGDPTASADPVDASASATSRTPARSRESLENEIRRLETLRTTNSSRAIDDRIKALRAELERLRSSNRESGSADPK